jgi:TrmH family RNA methyltransferase
LNLVVVLNNPQDLVNIASVVRVMNNFGLRDLRLVSPDEFEPRRISGIAHASGDLIKRIEILDDLDSALADRVYVMGMTARQRAAKRNVMGPRDAAADLLAATDLGPAALVLGREDRGLTNDELDRCHKIVTIPTTPDFASLNISQAFTVMAYELFVGRERQVFKQPRRAAEPATQEELELFFSRAEDALGAIEFFKTRNTATIMRTVREVVHRAPMDSREVTLFKAMCIEVVRYLERVGVR